MLYKIEPTYEERMQYEDYKKIVIEAVKRDPELLKTYAAGMATDKDVTIAAVQTDGMALRHISYRLRFDKDVAIAALKQNPVLWDADKHNYSYE